MTTACPEWKEVKEKKKEEAQKNPVEKKSSRKRLFSTHGSDCIRIGLRAGQREGSHSSSLTSLAQRPQTKDMKYSCDMPSR